MVTLRHPSEVLQSNSDRIETSPDHRFFAVGGFRVCAWSHGVSGAEQEVGRLGFETLI